MNTDLLEFFDHSLIDTSLSLETFKVVLESVNMLIALSEHLFEFVNPRSELLTCFLVPMLLSVLLKTNLFKIVRQRIQLFVETFDLFILSVRVLNHLLDLSIFRVKQIFKLIGLATEQRYFLLPIFESLYRACTLSA